jgi:hypothetical protein
MKWCGGKSQIRQANHKFLPVLTKQQVVIGNRCSQKRLKAWIERLPGGVKRTM